MNHIAQYFRSSLKLRHEEPFGIVDKFSSRIIFELDHLEQDFCYLDDEEDLSMEFDRKDRYMVIRTLVVILSEMVSRDSKFLT